MSRPGTPGSPETPEEPEPGGEPASSEPAEPDQATRPWWASPASSRLTPTEPTPTQSGASSASTGQKSAEPMGAAPAEPTGAEPTGAQPASAPPATPVADGSRAATAGAAASPSVMDQPDRQRTPTGLAWAAGVLLAIVILFALFFLGQRIGSSPAVAPTPTPTPTPSPTAAQEPGVHVWNTMFGGECLQPYTSPWDHDFTVVDCATPHTAQLVYRGRFDAKQTEFPGEKALSDQINDLCSAAGIVDLDAARDYPHLVVQGSYPITQRQWEENPYYYCFVSSSSGQQLTADIAGPGPKPAAAASPAPAAASAG